jgi:hypothetical protein
MNNPKTDLHMKGIQVDSSGDFQQFRIDAKFKISENGKKINRFKTDMKSSGKNVKTNYSDEAALLEKQNNDLKSRINDYKYDGKDKWEKFKIGFSHDLDACGNSVVDLVTKRH